MIKIIPFVFGDSKGIYLVYNVPLRNYFASNLRYASTLELDKKVRECAIPLNDSKRIAKLSTGDLIAVEAKYHAAFLEKKQCSDAIDSSSVDLEELAFGELIGYIEECLEQEAPGVLTLSELVKFYQCKLKEVGAESGETNATRLKEKVLEAPMALPNKELKAPALGQQSLESSDSTCNDEDDEKDWLSREQELYNKEELDPKHFVSWAAYRASKTPLSIYKPAIVTLLPLFTENAHSLALIAHSMKVIKAAVQHLNPLQTPVIALDQPLYALAKQIQWTLPEFVEDKFLAMMGGLHIEMASLKMLGKWLTGCGWSEIMYSAGVATQGIAESFLTASHVTRTRRAHQVTAASLHILKKKAYIAYKDKLEEAEQSLTFEDWENTMEKKSPHFLFWGLVLHLELTCLRLVRAFKEANFTLYVDAIQQILPWMFVMDHTNYARWLAVHYWDMQVLSSKHPDVYKHFSDGAFVVHKTNRAFSSIALDHAHEQVNALVKGQGGAVGLTENPAALRRWMVAGPELSRNVEEFEGSSTVSEERDHLEQKPGVQSTFLKDVVNTVSCFEELGNPFTEESENLMAIHTKDIMDDSVVATVKNAHKIVEEQFCLFVKERFIDRSKPVTEPLKKNNLPTFSTPTKKAVSKDQAKVKLLKEDCSLFGRFYIACQTRDGNLDEFFFV